MTIRSKKWPLIFDNNGNIRTDRVPEDPAPLLWSHGLPWAPVYRNYYVLCGRQATDFIQAYCIGPKSDSTHKGTKVDFTIGQVILPDAVVFDQALVANKSIIRQFYHATSETALGYRVPSEHKQKRYDTMGSGCRRVMIGSLI